MDEQGFDLIGHPGAVPDDRLDPAVSAFELGTGAARPGYAAAMVAGLTTLAIAAVTIGSALAAGGLPGEQAPAMISTPAPEPARPVPAASPSTRATTLAAPLTTTAIDALTRSTTRTQLADLRPSTGDGHYDSFSFTVRDTKGKAWVGAGVGDDRWPAYQRWDCTPAQHCTQQRVGAATLYTYLQKDADHTGTGFWSYLARPDHLVVWIGQTNTVQPNGAITRPTVPLTEDEVVAFVTDPRWDKLSGRLPAKQPYFGN